ncbi:UDP-glucose 4-epimerase GalE [Paenibacillus methanolicus]|uniref:UDP-glucose 4-epimerase n=1 Tax=Paenibacillus methanolicus TaxID=582686 RepID=A0A5S5CBF0_9BACL|nr:UDP-glucose 4-epimerase GalE [Paenibacillus methanolicus]TYP75670.1 UDP-glucose 4-epimerase [Paenibacillus methanolicus]
MAILVTGGAGFIGSHTCIELLNSGYDLVVVDNLSNSSMASIKKVEEITAKKVPFYNVDLLDKDSLGSVFLHHDFESVIHFAGVKAVGESTQNPLKYYQNNVMGTLNLCEVMQNHKVLKMVFSSSATVYSPSASGIMTEENLLGASNPYGRTKLMIEELLKDLSASNNNWSISILRYFNPIGAHSSGQIGEDPKGTPNNLLPYIAQVASGKLPIVRVYGIDYDTIDGTGVRDYVHVVDLAKGHIKALDKVKTSNGVSIYNLGTGKGYSVLEMIRAFERVADRKIPYKIEARRDGDVAICYADPSKAMLELGWVAVRDIEEMCEDAWRWQKNYPEGYTMSEMMNKF